MRRNLPQRQTEPRPASTATVTGCTTSKWRSGRHFFDGLELTAAPSTPPQDFLLMLDTGSPLTWVFDSSCTPQKCSNKTGVGFDAGHSSTYRLNATFQHTIVYIDQGACNGPWGYDTVGITNGMSGPQRVNSSADNIFFSGLACGLRHVSEHMLIVHPQCAAQRETSLSPRLRIGGTSE